MGNKLVVPIPKGVLAKVVPTANRIIKHYDSIEDRRSARMRTIYIDDHTLLPIPIALHPRSEGNTAGMEAFCWQYRSLGFNASACKLPKSRHWVADKRWRLMHVARVLCHELGHWYGRKIPKAEHSMLDHYSRMIGSSPSRRSRTRAWNAYIKLPCEVKAEMTSIRHVMMPFLAHANAPALKAWARSKDSKFKLSDFGGPSDYYSTSCLATFTRWPKKLIKIVRKEALRELNALARRRRRGPGSRACRTSCA